MKRRIIGLLFGAGVVALVAVGVVAFALPGDSEPVSDIPVLEKIESAGEGIGGVTISLDDPDPDDGDDRTVEVSWVDRDGETGTETYTIDLSDAPDRNADAGSTEPSPPDAGDRNE